MKKRLLSILMIAVILLIAVVGAFASEAAVKGDADGDEELAILDATAIQRHLAGIQKLSAEAVKRSMVSGEPELCILDATMIQRMLAGIINEFPADIPSGDPLPELPTDVPAETPTVIAPTEQIVPVPGPDDPYIVTPTDAPTQPGKETPTADPAEAPTAAPTAAPTTDPVTAPTEASTAAPTTGPVTAPTEASTAAPTEAPTEAPTTIHEYTFSLTVPQKFCAIQFELYYDPDVYSFVDAAYPYFWEYDEVREQYSSFGNVIINDGNNASRAAAGKEDTDAADFLPGRILFNASVGSDMYSFTKGRMLVNLKLSGPVSATARPEIVLKRVADVAISNDDHGQSLPFTWTEDFDGSRRSGSFEGGIIGSLT